MNMFRQISSTLFGGLRQFASGNRTAINRSAVAINGFSHIGKSVLQKSIEKDCHVKSDANKAIKKNKDISCIGVKLDTIEAMMSSFNPLQTESNSSCKCNCTTLRMNLIHQDGVVNCVLRTSRVMTTSQHVHDGISRIAQNLMGNKCFHTSSSLDSAKTVRIESPIARAFASGESNENKFSNLEVDRKICTLIPGDGVYPELMKSVQTVMKAIEAPIDFETIIYSEVQSSNSAQVEDVIKSINRNRICLMGSMMTPEMSYSGELLNFHMKLRKGLDLYSNVVHIVSWPGLPSGYNNIDTVIIREFTEGEYSALEHESVDGVVECLKVVTATKSQKIAKFAFDYALRNNRKHITCVHKANIMKLGDGLFLKSCSEIKQLYPNVNFDSMIVDNCTMQMVSNPQQFDILVMPNLYGNILDNLAASLVGGSGVVASSSFSPECVVFEPGARHVFQTAIGKNIANPTAMLMCASKMLKHVNLQQYSNSIETGIKKVLTAGRVRTRDLGGSSSTDEFTDAVIKAIV